MRYNFAYLSWDFFLFLFFVLCVFVLGLLFCFCLFLDQNRTNGLPRTLREGGQVGSDRSDTDLYLILEI